jgi:hypothetical protein
MRKTLLIVAFILGIGATSCEKPTVTQSKNECGDCTFKFSSERHVGNSLVFPNCSGNTIATYVSSCNSDELAYLTFIGVCEDTPKLEFCRASLYYKDDNASYILERVRIERIPPYNELRYTYKIVKAKDNWWLNKQVSPALYIPTSVNTTNLTVPQIMQANADRFNEANTIDKYPERIYIK